MDTNKSKRVRCDSVEIRNGRLRRVGEEKKTVTWRPAERKLLVIWLHGLTPRMKSTDRTGDEERERGGQRVKKSAYVKPRSLHPISRSARQSEDPPPAAFRLAERGPASIVFRPTKHFFVSRHVQLPSPSCLHHLTGARASSSSSSCSSFWLPIDIVSVAGGLCAGQVAERNVSPVPDDAIRDSNP
ncbi:hypothetical protein BHE74_00017381 [Ensete ventricosum]|nr:hypothetical protein BHE74_00017381 [Ensete ventricosum]